MPAHTPEEIHALIAAAVSEGDVDAFVALHEADATTVVPTDGRQVRGHEEIRVAVAPVFALRPNARIEVLGKLEGSGLALTHARVELTAADAEPPLAFTGRGTIVSRRQPDGTWRIVLDNPLSPA